jgi:hypothetical protein
VIESRVSRESMRDLEQAIRKFEAGLNVTHKSAMYSATRKVLTSLAKDTKTAPKYREYRDTGEQSRSGLNRRFEVWTNYQGMKRRGKVTRASFSSDPDKFRWQDIWAKNVQQLKRRPAMRVHMRGLAAESWRQMGRFGRIRIQDKATDTADKRSRRIVQKAARRWVDLSMNLRGPAKYVTLRNDLRYIREAVGGPGNINAAIQKGARALLHEMERKVSKGWA